jgi:hypothetical protein
MLKLNDNSDETKLRASMRIGEFSRELDKH